MCKSYYLAIDIGASSGRHIVGWRENGEIQTDEVYRFPNSVEQEDGHLIWNMEQLLADVKTGIASAKAKHPKIESLSIDTWAVDYVLLRGNEPVFPCYAYRDSRTEAVIPQVHGIVPFEELYARTGIQFQPFNTIYQLYADKLAGRLDGVTDFLMIPKYLMYRLTGSKAHEYTNATTTGLVSAVTGEFDRELIKKLGLPPALFGQLSQPGTVIGEYEGIRVVLCATHDTASAVEGIPMEGNHPYISSGTWSLLGVKTGKPITDTASPFMKEELRKLDTITAQVDYLTKNRIETLDDLLSAREAIQSEMDTLTEQRTKLQNKIRRASPAEKERLRAEKQTVTKKITVCRKKLKLNTRPPVYPCNWSSGTVAGILDRQEYVGDTVNFRTCRQSFKQKKQLDRPQEDWKVFSDTHPAIIDRETFALVQNLRQHRRRPNRTGIVSMFSGLLYCADCGEKLYYGSSKSSKQPQAYFFCSSYRKNSNVCSAHYIRESVVGQLVLEGLQRLLWYIQVFEKRFAQEQMERFGLQEKKELTAKRRELDRAKQRVAEIDQLIQKSYEDMTKGLLSEERFATLTVSLENEQRQLKVDIPALEDSLNATADKADDLQKFIQRARQVTRLTELTPEIVHEFIDKIVVSKPEKIDGKRHQRVDIYYSTIGLWTAPEPETLEREYMAYYQAMQKRKKRTA